MIIPASGILNIAHAEENIVSLTVSDKDIDMGKTITVSVNNIPKSLNRSNGAFYTLVLHQSPAGEAAKLISQLTIEVKLDLNGKIFCVATDKGRGWQTIRCPESPTSFTFTAQLDSNNIDAERVLKTRGDKVSYTVSLSTTETLDPRSSIETTFTVISSQDQGLEAFVFNQPPLSPNPADLGQEISISIDVKNSGLFTPYILNYNPTSSIPDYKGIGKNCNVGQCTLSITLPTTGITKSPIQINVRGTDAYGREKPGLTTLLDITSITPQPTGLLIITPVPPSPTIPPAILPCLEGLSKPEDPKSITKIKAEIKKCTKIDSAIGPISTDPAEFVKKIFTVLLSMAGGWAVYIIIVAGYVLIFSHGEAEKVKEAREEITSAIVGIVFMLLSLVILRVIGVDIFDLPTFR